MHEIIKQLRLKNDWTQEQFGEFLGVQKSAVRKWEKGTVENIKRTTIVKMSEVFNVSPAYLMGWQEEPVVQDFRTTEPMFPTSVSGTSKDEQELIQNYNNLNDEGKERLLENSREYTELSKYKKDNQSEMGKKQA